MFAETARAEAFAPAPRASACLVASTGADSRIVFHNRCAGPRNFSWCAEHDRMPVPAAVACTAGRLGPEQVFQIVHRKEFLWHLPAGARIRLHDCPEGELPTAEFDCAAPPPPPRR